MEYVEWLDTNIFLKGIRIMKKLVCIIMVLLSVSILFSGCGNESKIKELQNNILELEEENEDNQIFLNSWQNKYDDAKEMYDSTMSMSNPEQRHLDYAKEQMDEATKEINALKRKIDLNNLSIKHYQEQIEELQN